MQTGRSIAPMGGHLGGPTRSRPDSNRYRAPTPGDGGSSAAAPGIQEAATSDGSPMKLKAGDVFPDLHHKMSKKIAQLTKVIYHLNTKNEDRQARVACLRVYSLCAAVNVRKRQRTAMHLCRLGLMRRWHAHSVPLYM